MWRKIFNLGIYIFAIIGLVLTGGYFAVRFGLTKNHGLIDTQQEAFLENNNGSLYFPNASWPNEPEWQTFEDAIKKDELVIKDVAKKTDIPPRLIVSISGVEQLRLFYTERALFKEVFAPLKVLGVQSQFSWGVMGIKEDTAKEIERNLKDPSSPFYPGKEYENILDFKTSDVDSERYTRLTDSKDRSYSYLYAAVLIKEIETQWKKSGFSINDNPGVIATLYNIGFINSKPNADPKLGGARIDIDNVTYSFGSLAHDVYYGEKLLDVFPR